MKPIVLVCAMLVAACGSGAAPLTSAPPTPAAQLTVAPPKPRQTPGPIGTPIATQLAGVTTRIIPLGSDSTPIDVVYAFDSIWVASHHYNAVFRLDPTTLA